MTTQSQIKKPPRKLLKKNREIIEKKRNREGKEFFTSVVVKKTGKSAPMGCAVDLRKFDDVRLKRIVLGTGTAPMPSYSYFQYGPIIFKDSQGNLLEYQFDEISEGEPIEAYLERHYETMKAYEIVHLPNERSFMTADAAHEWALKLGFTVSLEKIQQYIEQCGPRGMNLGTLNTDTFFNELCNGTLG